jgi:hypothetical protein
VCSGAPGAAPLAHLRTDCCRAQDIEITKLLAGHQGVLLELLQWLCKYLEKLEPAKNYDPAARRAMSKHGGCNKIPRYGVSKEAFRRWRMQGALVIGHLHR